ncbi:MAG: hypothetical protein GY854_14290 [Deltaproteobacteria bacterium]|nr:hypothetical protein [Deltaproteobacteria bacterium]
MILRGVQNWITLLEMSISPANLADRVRIHTTMVSSEVRRYSKMALLDDLPDNLSLEEILAVERVWKNTESLPRYVFLKTLFFNDVIRYNDRFRSSDLLYRLACLSRDFGDFSTSIEACNRLLQSEGSNQIDDNFLYRVKLVEAKAYRGLGCYRDAYRCYMYLLGRFRDQILKQAYVLMMIGKMSENMQWRTGQYEELIKLAIVRLENLLSEEDNPAYQTSACRFLAICYDSLASIAYEIRFNLNRQADRKRVRSDVLSLSSRALEYNSRVGNPYSERRIQFRRDFILFKLSDSMDEKYALVDQYARRLDTLFTKDSIHRGWAVRRGQYGEMQFEIHNHSTALKILDQSIRNARLFSDWRTHARNCFRKAKLMSFWKNDHLAFMEQTGVALTGLSQNMKDHHPEIEIDILREKAKHYFEVDEINKGMIEFDTAIKMLSNLEERLIDDYNAYQGSDEESDFKIKHIVTDVEWLKLQGSLMLDFRIFSGYMKMLTKDLNSYTQQNAKKMLMISEESKQLGWLYHSKKELRHRLKNLLSGLINDIVRKVESLSDSIKEPRNIKIIKDITGKVSALDRDLVAWREMIDMNLEKFKQGISEVVASELLSEVINTLSMEQVLDERLSVEAEVDHTQSSSDFVIYGSKDLIKQSLINYIENSAKVLRKIEPLRGDPKIKIRAYWDENCGVFEVEDNGNLADDLKKANNADVEGQVSDENEGGLLLAWQFFNVYFDAKIDVVSRDGGLTVLIIRIPRSEKVYAKKMQTSRK